MTYTHFHQDIGRYLLDHCSEQHGVIIQGLNKVLPGAIVKVVMATPTDIFLKENAQGSSPADIQSWVFWEDLFWGKEGFYTEEQVKAIGIEALVQQGFDASNIRFHFFDEPQARNSPMPFSNPKAEIWRQEFEVFFQKLVLDHQIPFTEHPKSSTRL